MKYNLAIFAFIFSLISLSSCEKEIINDSISISATSSQENELEGSTIDFTGKETLSSLKVGVRDPLLQGGENMEGTGIPPKITSNHKTPDIQGGNDFAMGNKIQYLFDGYGIE